METLFLYVVLAFSGMTGDSEADTAAATDGLDGIRREIQTLR